MRQLKGIIYNLRFPGQYYQSETGLNYNSFRDYDPQTGRFVESDPVGLLGGINTYAYVDDDPIDNSDPLGLFQYRKPNPNIGTIICNGTGGVAVQFPATIDPKAEKCLGDCLRAHEVSHISDLRRLGPGLCKGQARGVIPTFDTTAQLLASERKAYDVELACLQKKLEGMSDCDECKKWIQTRIQTVTQAHP